MGIYFSAETGGFYDDNVHGPRQIEAPQTAREIKAGKRPAMIDNPDCLIPADAVAITDAQYRALMAAQSGGKAIVAKAGRPVAVDRTQDEEERQRLRRRRRDILLAQSDWTQLPDTLVDQPELKAAWAAYRQLLRDLDMTGSDWPTAPGAAEAEAI